MQRARAVLYCLSPLPLCQLFPHYFIRGKILGGKKKEIFREKRVFISSGLTIYRNSRILQAELLSVL